MAHAQPQIKYMTMMPPRFGATGAQVLALQPAICDLTNWCGTTQGPGAAQGNAYVFFIAEQSAYIMTAPTAGQAIELNPGSAGLPTTVGTTGGSIPTVPQNQGVCGLLPAMTLVRFLLEPGVDVFMGCMLMNPTYDGQQFKIRWWRASMLSNG